MTAGEKKARQRSAAVAARRAADPAARKVWDHAIARRVLDLPEFRRARVILSYCAMAGEADPAEIDRAARALGKVVAYPRCCGEGVMIAAVPEAEDALERSPLGMMEPAPGRYSAVPPEALDLVLAPCAAFDSRCVRIGMGGGYYDRYLPLCTGVRVAALAYEVQRVPRAEREAHDVPVDAVVSDRALYRAEEQA